MIHRSSRPGYIPPAFDHCAGSLALMAGEMMTMVVCELRRLRKRVDVNLKDIRYLHRRRQEVLLSLNPLQRRHRPSRRRWPGLEKAAVQSVC